MTEEPIEYCLYVKNIPKTVTRDQIEDLFDKIAPVEKLNLLTDNNTKAFKGVVFVSYKKKKDCLAAIQAYHKTNQWGQQISVAFSDRTKERMPANEKDAILYMAEEMKRRNQPVNRVDEVNNSLSFVAPIEIMIGSLYDAGEKGDYIKKELASRMLPLDLKDVEPLLNELIDRVVARRQRK